MVGCRVGGVDDEVAVDLVRGGDEDGLAVDAVELEIRLVERGEIGAGLELLEGEGALDADLGGDVWAGGRGRGGTGRLTWTSNVGGQSIVGISAGTRRGAL